MIKISVIIPMWNVEDYILDALKSVYTQSFKDYEVICVDDGSIDNTIKIVEEFITDKTNFKLIKIPHSGVSIARNLAIEVSFGEYIFFLDADDKIYTKTTLQDLYMCAKNNNADIVFSSFINSFGCSSNKLLSNSYGENISGITILENCDFGSLQGNPSQYFCKAALIKDNNIRFLENYYMEDLLFLTEILIHAKICNVSKYKSIIKRIRKEAITNSNGLYNIDILKVIEEHIVLFEKYKLNDLLLKYKTSILKQVLFFYKGIKNNERLKNNFRDTALDLYKRKIPEMLSLIQSEFDLYEKERCLCGI